MGRIKRYLFLLIVFVFSILLAEAILRIAGKQPLSHSPFEFSTIPLGYASSDSMLGYRFVPGNFNVIYANGFSFRANHDSSGHRIVDTKVSDSLQKLVIMGCSFAYGQGVNDTQTMAYYLQEKSLDMKVQNYGVPGYGTVQQCLLLKQILKGSQLPQIVVFTYASFHHERNVGSRKYIKMMTLGAGNTATTVRIPYWNKLDELEYTSVRYPLLRLCITSALVNTFDDVVNHILFQQEEAFAITCANLLNAAESCKSKNIFFGVLCLKSDSYSIRMITFCRENNIAFTAPLTMPLEANNKFYYLPDGHPTNTLQRIYAEALVKMKNRF